MPLQLKKLRTKMNTLYERLKVQHEAINKRLKNKSSEPDKNEKKCEQPVENKNNEHYQVCPMCGEKKLVFNCGWSACG